MDTYSDEEFEYIVKQSNSFKNCLENLGYNSNSGQQTHILQEKIKSLNIDISHFDQPKEKIIRTPENVFIENSTAVQKVLRSWYIKGNYTPYVCAICGQEPIWQGKKLTLILDHINGKNHDDRLENLRWVCPNCNQQLDTTNGRNPNRKYEINYCLDCGKIIGPKSIRCQACATKFRTSDEVKQVSREELKQLIRNESFTKIGKIYGVSDNSVRKWCDKYKLPRRMTDIKQISDQDWEKI